MIKQFKDINEINDNKTTVVMFQSEHCGYCQQAKPKYEELSEKFPDIEFKSIEFNQEAMPIYSRYIKEAPLRVQVTDENGVPVYNEDGSPMMTYKVGEDGKLEKHVPVAIPNFFVFNKQLSDDEFGFLGNVEGAALEQLEHILKELNNGQ